jgi:hypothetical protein
MSQAKNVTQPILGKTRDQEEKEHEKSRLVVKEIIEPLDGGFGDELLYEGPPERPREDEGGVRTESEPDGGEHDTEKLAEQVPSKKPCDLTGKRCGDHLSDLKQDKDNHGPRAEGVQEVCHLFLVQEKVDDAGFVEDQSQTPNNEDENQKPEPDVDCFCLLRHLRIHVVIRRVVPPQLLVRQIAAFLQTP